MSGWVKKLASLCLGLALLLGGCGTEKVDITITPSPGAGQEPVPEETAQEGQMPDYRPEDMVKVVDIIPDIHVELRYAGEDNFTGEALYKFSEAYLRYGTALKLARVQEQLRPLGLSLCVWDGWRPAAAQFAFWRLMPDARYVANPFNGLSGHCRGNTVDITLVTAQGGAVEMPTDLDNFTALADRDYSDVSPAAARNAQILEQAMAAAGFEPYFAEWWHYTDSESYEVRESLEEPETVDITENTLLRASPGGSEPALALLPAGERVRVLDRLDGWLLVGSAAGYGYIVE